MWTRARRLAAGGRSTPRRSETQRARRGATLVFVAVFALALVGVAAFAIDASRLYVGANELQTGADATALRAARYMQTVSGGDPTETAQAFAPSNESLGSGLQLAASEVVPIIYNPTNKTFAAATWATANAVEIRGSRVGNLLFGRLLTNVMPVPNRRAVAWVANVTRVSCPAPLGFPMEALNNRLYGTTDDNTVRASLYASLLEKQENPLSITMVLYPSGATEAKTSPAGAWDFKAIDNTEGPGGNGMNGYADQLAGVSCNANGTTAIDSTEVFKGQGKGSVDQKTYRAAHNNQGGPNNGQTFCQPGNAPVCYPKPMGATAPAGVVRDVSWIGTVSGGSAPVKTLGGFKVMCVFEGKKGNGKNKGEECPWYDDYRASAYAPPGLPEDLPQGTIVGYPVPSAPGLGSGTSLGTQFSTGQRLILVR
jgi:Flp pilus assembly protein TadG